MVTSAVKWITGVSHSSNFNLEPRFDLTQAESVNLTTIVNNPSGNKLEVWALIENSLGEVEDSIELISNGIEGMVAEGDTIWSGTWNPENLYLKEDFYNIVLKTKDLTSNSLFQPSYPWISSAGPVIGSADTLVKGFFYHQLTCTLTSNGITKSIPNVEMKLESLNELATTTGNKLAFGELQPGEYLISEHSISLSDEIKPGDTLIFQAKIYSNKANYWIDTLEYIMPYVSKLDNVAAESGIKIFPNPIHDLLHIETKSNGTLQFEISSLNGQLLLNGEMEETTHQIDLSSYQKGVYFITIRSKDFVTTRKIIKL